MPRFSFPLRGLGPAGATANARSELDLARQRAAQVEAVIDRLAPPVGPPVPAAPPRRVA